MSPANLLNLGRSVLLSVLPGLVGAVIVLSGFALVYLGLLFFAFRRRYRLPLRFHLLVFMFAGLVFLSTAFYSWPSEVFKLPALLFSSTAFVTCLLGAYLGLTAVDVFLVDYYLVTVRGVYVSPPARKLISVVAFLIASLISLNIVFHFNPATRLASLSVGGFAIGLALQDTLKNIIASLSLGRLLRIGDWVKVKGLEGQVADLNWARLTLRTIEGDQVYIPNKELQQTELMNFTLGRRAHRARLEVGVSYGADPRLVKRTLTEAAAAAPGVLTDPAPETVVTGFGDSAVLYSLFFWLDNYGEHFDVTDAVATRAWHALRRRGLEIPFPIRTVYMRQEEAPEDGAGESARWLSEVELFSAVPAEDLRALAQAARRQTFLKGEEIFRQGDAGSSLFVLLKGKAAVLLSEAGKGRSRVAGLGPGSFFGEMSLLTGEPRSATVLVEEDAELLVVTRESFQAVLDRHPGLSEAIAQTVIARKARLEAARRNVSEAPAKTEDVTSLKSRIRKFFGLG